MNRTQLQAAYTVFREDGLRSLFRTVVRNTGLFNGEILYRKLKLRIRHGDAAAHPYSILDVDPAQIRFWAPNHNKFHLPERGFELAKHEEFDVSLWDYAGETIAGAWDKRENVHLLEETPKYQGLSEHFVEGVPWEQTTLFEILLELIDEYGTHDGCQNRDELERRYQTIETLYRNLKREGYRSQRELHAGSGVSKTIVDEIGVGIGRKGEIRFIGSGWHRLCLAKIIGLESVKVRVVCRHSRWQDRRAEIVDADEIDQLRPGTRAQTSHPDLADITPQEWQNTGGQHPTHPKSSTQH